MLLCFYTKESKDISHINCFYFWIVSLLCFHSSSLTDVLGTFFVLVPPWPHATSSLPGITCPRSLIRSSMTVHPCGALPWDRDVSEEQLPSQGPHFPASLALSWRQVTEFFLSWMWEDALYFQTWPTTPSVLSLSASAGWMLMPWVPS